MSTGTGPGWYPDPTGRFDVRYHNGRTWTGDVATGGNRFVDTMPLTPPSPVTPLPGGRPARNGIATAAMTCGIVALATGWIPFVAVAGVVLAVLAIVFGIVGLRRSRRSGTGRTFAITGLVTGSLGLASAAVGMVLTVVTFRAIERYEDPAARDVQIDTCESGDDGLVVGGTLRNLDDETASFTVFVSVERTASGAEVDSFHIELDDVEPDEVVRFEEVRRTQSVAVECRVDEVKGPLPFGIVPE